MKPTTMTTCDDNVPFPALFLDEDHLNGALLDHYRSVWIEVGADGECPGKWAEIRDELQSRDLLRDRHVVHLHVHELFAA